MEPPIDVLIERVKESKGSDHLSLDRYQASNEKFVASPETLNFIRKSIGIIGKDSQIEEKYVITLYIVAQKLMINNLIMTSTDTNTLGIVHPLIPIVPNTNIDELWEKAFRGKVGDFEDEDGSHLQISESYVYVRNKKGKIEYYYLGGRTQQGFYPNKPVSIFINTDDLINSLNEAIKADELWHKKAGNGRNINDGDWFYSKYGNYYTHTTQEIGNQEASIPIIVGYKQIIDFLSEEKRCCSSLIQQDMSSFSATEGDLMFHGTLNDFKLPIKPWSWLSHDPKYPLLVAFHPSRVFSKSASVCRIIEFVLTKNVKILKINMTKDISKEEALRLTGGKFEWVDKTIEDIENEIKQTNYDGVGDIVHGGSNEFRLKDVNLLSHPRIFEFNFRWIFDNHPKILARMKKPISDKFNYKQIKSPTFLTLDNNIHMISNALPTKRLCYSLMCQFYSENKKLPNAVALFMLIGDEENVTTIITIQTTVHVHLTFYDDEEEDPLANYQILCIACQTSSGTYEVASTEACIEDVKQKTKDYCDRKFLKK